MMLEEHMLYVMITAAMLASGLLMLSLTIYHRSEASRSRHMRSTANKPIPAGRYRIKALLNSAVSFSLVYGVAFVLEDIAFTKAAVPAWRIAAEIVGILLFYDFMYYFVHRYPFHEWKLLRHVHAVHHVVRYPTAVDSLYLHWLEDVLGLSLMWISVFTASQVIGPVSIYAFGGLFFIYTLSNIVVHSGLKFTMFPFNITTYLGERHYKHHLNMKSGNYASLTPIFDMLFGTEEPRASEN